MVFVKNRFAIAYNALAIFMVEGFLLAADKQKIQIKTPSDVISGIDFDESPGYRNNFLQYEDSLYHNFDTRKVQDRLKKILKTCFLFCLKLHKKDERQLLFLTGFLLIGSLQKNSLS